MKLPYSCILPVLLTLIHVISAEVVFRWNEIEIPPLTVRKWRPTSFAVTKDTIFLTMVDLNKSMSGNGILGYFDKVTTRKAPTLKVYPSADFYNITKPAAGILTPISIRADECDRLWLLDAAVQNISGTQKKTTPSIYIFDRKDNILERSYSFPNGQWSGRSFFVNLAVSSENHCKDTLAYIADFNRFKLVTYDYRRNNSKVFSHHFFNPDPLVYTPEDFLFSKRDQDSNGIYGLALSYSYRNESEKLFLHPLASTNKMTISTDILLTRESLDYNDVQLYKQDDNTAQSGFASFDNERRILFYSEINTKKIGCWKVDVAPSKASVASIDIKLTDGYVVDMQVIDSHLWILIYHLNSKISIRKESINELTKGTSCTTNSASSARTAELKFISLLSLVLLWLRL